MLPNESVALYLHVPFCKKKCPYCDFYSIALDETNALFEAYTGAIIKELKYYSVKNEWKNKQIESIYLGGGTPSLLTARQIEKILTSIKNTYPLQIAPEISIEVNPVLTSMPKKKSLFKDLKALGFTRVSIGVQSFSEQKLKFLGRLHNSDEAREAVDLAYSAGFSNISIDLIFGTPNETLLDWENDITETLKIRPQHISAYSLTIEPGSEFYKLQTSGHKVTATDDVMAGMYKCSQQILQENGFIHYEISNYAKPSYECRHNISYWTYKNYLGLGPGAHSYLQSNEDKYGIRWSNIRDVKEYVSMIENSGEAKERLENLSREEARLEFFLLSLRQKVGINKADYRKKFNENFNQRYEKVIRKLLSENLIGNSQDSLFLTDSGFLLSDSVIAEFADA